MMMMMMSKMRVFELVLGILAALNSFKASADGIVEKNIIVVKSIDELLSNSEFYDGKKIAIRGYFVFRFEWVNLYETQKDFADANEEKCITVGMGSMDDERLMEFSDEYVRFIGIFDANLCKKRICNYACRKEGITDFTIELLR